MHVGVMDGSSSQTQPIEWRTTSSYIAIRTLTLMKRFYLLKSCQILTKLLEKIDRSLGGGSVFIEFKNLQLSEVTTLTSYVSDAEMILGKFHIHKQKPLHICSLYRPPNSSSSPIISLNNCLSQLYTEDSENSPCSYASWW